FLLQVSHCKQGSSSTLFSHVNERDNISALELLPVPDSPDIRIKLGTASFLMALLSILKEPKLPNKSLNL
ncbi:hypothetical protein RF031_06710, partial [Acinetobacter baumannii]|nr:hypothetical protein [Acinetobacter baumannii]